MAEIYEPKNRIKKPNEKKWIPNWIRRASWNLNEIQVHRLDRVLRLFRWSTQHSHAQCSVLRTRLCSHSTINKKDNNKPRLNVTIDGVSEVFACLSVLSLWGCTDLQYWCLCVCVWCDWLRGRCYSTSENASHENRQDDDGKSSNAFAHHFKRANFKDKIHRRNASALIRVNWEWRDSLN